MGSTTLTAKRQLGASCIDCGEMRLFILDTEASRGDVAVYECEECEHGIEVHLDP